MRSVLLFASVVAGCASDEDLDGDGVVVGADCNDADPGQTAPRLLHIDADGDGFAGEEQELGCPGSAWLFVDVTDCDDADPAVHPEAIEIGCDGRDNDCDEGTADGPAVSVGSAWPSIQIAIDAAGFHERVEVCASTVKEDLTIQRPVDLTGAGVGLTIIEGTGSGPVFHIEGDGTRIAGLTITGGSGLEVDGRRVGGGVVVAGEMVTLEGVEVTGNEAVDGGGIAVLPGASISLVGGTTVHDNTAVDRGGGLYAEDATSIALKDSSLSANVALEGGGFWLRGSATIEASDISDNHANSAGGGVVLDSLVDVSQLVGVTDAVVRGNSAEFGGGVWGEGDVVGMTVEGNDADQGGGLYATGPMGLFQSSLIDNRSVATDGGMGGGVMLPPGTFLHASDVAILGNSAEGWGGALMADTASFLLYGLQIESNIAEYGAGMALVGDCPTCMLDGNALEFRANVAGAAGADIVFSAEESALELSDVLLHAGTAPHAPAISIMAGTVELRNVEVSGALSGSDGAAIELGSANAWLVVSDGLFMSNEPADLRVLPFAPEAAPGPNFTCASELGCSLGP